MNQLPAILVVDDQQHNLVAMEAIFDGEPVDLVMATSGQEALRLLLQREFSLVLLDVQMPNLDGFEVAEIMRSNARTENVPIIFLTALSKEQRYIFRGYESGAVDYLFKPIEPVILRSKVRVFLELDRKSRNLRESLRLLQQERDNNQMLLRSLGEGLLGITQSGNIFYANPAAEQLLGHSQNDLIGSRLTEIFVLFDESGQQAEWPLADLLNTCARGESLQRDDLFMRRDGEEVAIEITANPLQSHTDSNSPPGVLVVFRDVSGLYNRAEFELLLRSHIAEANRNKSSIALLYVDLDRFKEINDTCGHHVGDEVLRVAAKRLSDSGREADMVARLGGDEFVMILESREPRRAASLVSGKVLQAFARVSDIEGSKIQIGCSIGIAIYPDDSTDPDELVKCADKAMYQAKAAGRSNSRFYRG